MKLGFIGAGNMAGAVMRGLVASKKVAAKDIVAYNPTKSKVERLQEELGIGAVASNSEVIAHADVVFVTVKPHMMEPVLGPLVADFKKKKPLIISVAAGTSIAYLQKVLDDTEAKVFRTLPNISVSLGCGLLSICASASVSEKENTDIMDMLSGLGRVVPLGEHMFATFSSVGAASHAFTLMYIDALAKAGLKEGLTKPQALEIATQAVLGLAELLQHEGVHPYVLIDRICSPGGTTICGVKALEDGAFVSTVMNAVAATSARDAEIAASKKG